MIIIVHLYNVIIGIIIYSTLYYVLMKKKELPTSYAFDIFVFELLPLGKILSRSMQEQQRV
jgi:hypothetical protein